MEILTNDVVIWNNTDDCQLFTGLSGFHVHRGVEMNNIADGLAKQAACLDFVGHELAAGLSATLICACVRHWVVKEKSKQ